MENKPKELRVDNVRYIREDLIAGDGNGDGDGGGYGGHGNGCDGNGCDGYGGH